MSPSEFDEIEADLKRAHRRRHRKELLWTVLICFLALVGGIIFLAWFWIES